MTEICEIKTIAVQAPNGATHGIMVAVNTDATGTPTTFVEELARKITLHRSCSPPDTSVLIVSLIGPFDADHFGREWAQALSSEDTTAVALRFFLKQMRTAVLVHGKRDGTVLEEVSLAPS